MIFFGAILIAGLIVLVGFVVMWLWNWLMPEIFGLPTLTYWQAVGLLLLAKLFFGFGMGGDSSSSDEDFDCSTDKKKKKKDFSKWKYYDKYWKEEGDKAYNAYLKKLTGESDSESGENESANSED